MCDKPSDGPIDKKIERQQAYALNALDIGMVEHDPMVQAQSTRSCIVNEVVLLEICIMHFGYLQPLGADCPYEIDQCHPARLAPWEWPMLLN